MYDMVRSWIGRLRWGPVCIWRRSSTFSAFLLVATLRAVVIYFPPAYLYANANDFWDGWLPFMYMGQPFYLTLFKLDATLVSGPGFPINYLGMSELNLVTIFFDLFPQHINTSLFMIVSCVLMFISTYAVAARLLKSPKAPQSETRWAEIGACLAALYFSIIDIQPSVVGTVVALNFTVYGALAIIQGDTGRRPVAAILIAPFLAQTPFGPIFYYPLFIAMALAFIRNPKGKRLLGLFLIASALTVLVDYRIFYMQLFDDTPTQRALWLRDDPQMLARLGNPANWLALLRLAREHMFEGQWHYAWNPRNTTLWLIMAGPLLLILKEGLGRSYGYAVRTAPTLRTIRVRLGAGFLIAVGALVVLSLGYGVLNGPVIDFQAIFHTPLNFDRAVLVLAPLAGSLALAVALALPLSAIPTGRGQIAAATALGAVMIASGTYASDNSRGKLEFFRHFVVNGWDNPFVPHSTVRLYYRGELFDALKSRLGAGWKDETVVSVGLDPFVAGVNGFKHLDGYFQMYPLSYKNEFRKIIADELELDPANRDYFDGWGSRVYIFATRFEDGKQLLNIDGCAFQDMGGTLLLSQYELADPSLSELVYFDTVSGVTMGLTSTLYLYRVSPTRCSASAPEA